MHFRRFSLTTVGRVDLKWVSQEVTWSTWWLISCVNLARSQHPGIWSNIVLDISVKLFLDEINTKILELKHFALQNVMGLFPWVEGPKRMKTNLPRRRRRPPDHLGFKSQLFCELQPAGLPCRYWAFRPLSSHEPTTASSKKLYTHTLLIWFF